MFKNTTTTLLWTGLKLPPINLYNAPYHKINEKYRNHCGKCEKKINNNINKLYENRKIN